MQQRSQAFTAYEWGVKAEPLSPEFPSFLSTWGCGQPLQLASDTVDVSHFGYVQDGLAMLVGFDRRSHKASFTYHLERGQYFCAPTSRDGMEWRVSGGKGIVVSRVTHRGMFSIGGPIEDTGRLRYIDGCTDSLLVPPVLMGDPCLNALYFPPGIDQTAHTHPSDRIGIIASGHGYCEFDANMGERPRDERIVGGRIDLTPGMVFCIHANGTHKFATPYREPMVVIAYHPESDFGPRHEDHPMLNRTIIEGVSAANPARAEYRTKPRDPVIERVPHRVA